MSLPSNSVSQSTDPQNLAPAAMKRTRPLCWSVQRELWENRSIYMAPLAAGAVYITGFLISLFSLPRRAREIADLNAYQQTHKLAQLYAHIGMLLLVVGVFVGIFYSLEALHGERRERSILFWKSLPVSDLTTVLSKASIPLIILPLLVFVIAVLVQIFMRWVSLAVLVLSGVGAATEWTRLPLVQMQFVLLYGVIVITLWHAPIYCWMLLISGWARRAAFLWAIVPWIAFGVFEQVAFHSSYLGLMLQNRIFGFADAAFDLKDASGAAIDPHFILLSQVAPGRFLTNPTLWLGLIFAALCLAAAVRLRRYRGPL